MDKKPQSEDAAMVLRQSKGGNSFLRQDTKLYVYCDKLGHIAFSLQKKKKKEKKNQGQQWLHICNA